MEKTREYEEAKIKNKNEKKRKIKPVSFLSTMFLLIGSLVKERRKNKYGRKGISRIEDFDRKQHKNWT